MMKKSGKGRARIWITAITTAVLVLLALTLFIYRDYLEPGMISSLFLDGETEDFVGEPYTFESGTDQVFSLAGNGLAMASKSSIQLLGDSGMTISHHLISLSVPALAASKELTAFYDIGGHTLRVITKSGEIINLDTEEPIISVTVNELGWLAVTTEAPGYKGVVTVYNKDLDPVYEWSSGSRYIISARVSPDCSGAVALCADESGGEILQLSFDSVEPKASFTAPEELLFDVGYIGGDKLCAVSVKRAVFLTSALELSGEYGFEDMFITDYDFGGDGYLAIFLGKYRSGNEGVLLTIDSAGQELGRVDIMRDLLSMSAGGGNLSVLYSDSLVSYSKTLDTRDEYEDILGVRKIFVRPKGDIVLVEAYSAQIYKAG